MTTPASTEDNVVLRDEQLSEEELLIQLSDKHDSGAVFREGVGVGGDAISSERG